MSKGHGMGVEEGCSCSGCRRIRIQDAKEMVVEAAIAWGKFMFKSATLRGVSDADRLLQRAVRELEEVSK